MTTPEDRVPAPAPAPGITDADADADYSATVLSSHWFQRPEPEPTATVAVPAATLPEAAATLPDPPAVRPDRVEGTVLRFGPGVTAALTHRTLPAFTVPPAPARPRRRLRRHALPVLVLVCVLALLLWQRLGPPVGVRAVSVTSRPAAVGCDGTADVVGLVTTDGRPGTLAYRWYRSDGTSSATLRESLSRGERHARLHLRWTFRGKGRYDARAELRILSPTHHSAATPLTYACS
ncbi:hypothetical protein [Streptomyces sp. NPDC047000]|uniref:hypothetical protein n=1 Tax=Streptomyces sp. NPDC047000 TaxID=3155474 RepID=UPI0033C6B9B0